MLFSDFNNTEDNNELSTSNNSDNLLDQQFSDPMNKRNNLNNGDPKLGIFTGQKYSRNIEKETEKDNLFNSRINNYMFDQFEHKPKAKLNRVNNGNSKNNLNSNKNIQNNSDNNNNILPSINSFEFCGEPEYQREVYNSRKKFNQDRMQEIFEPRPSFSYRNTSNNIKQKSNWKNNKDYDKDLNNSNSNSNSKNNSNFFIPDRLPIIDTFNNDKFNKNNKNNNKSNNINNNN